MKQKSKIIISVVILLLLYQLLDAEPGKRHNSIMSTPHDKSFTSFEIDNPSDIILDTVGDGYYISSYGDFIGFYPPSPPPSPLDDKIDSMYWDGKIFFVNMDGSSSYELDIEFDNPSALEIVGDTLYVADRYRLFLVDMNTDTTLDLIYIDSSSVWGLMDIEQDTSGYLYMTGNITENIFKYNISTKEIDSLITSGSSLDSLGSMVFIPKDNCLIIGTHKENAKIYRLDLDSNYVTVVKQTDIDYMTGIDTDSQGNIYIAQGNHLHQGRSFVTRFDNEFSSDSTVIIHGNHNNRNNNIFYNKTDDILALTSPSDKAVFFVDLSLSQDTVKLLYPADSATNVETDVEFTFERINDKSLSHYELWISKYSQTDTTHNLEYISRYDSLIIVKLENNCTYKWTVIASNGKVETKYIGRRTFTTRDTTITPIPIYPLDSATEVLSNVNFQWTQPTNSYKYLFEAYFDKYGFDEFLKIEADTNALMVEDFDVDSTYYWRVKAIGDSGATEWSLIYKFKTKAATMGLVKRLLPYSGLVYAETDMDFSWEPDTNATHYVLRVFFDSFIPFNRKTITMVHVDTTAYTVNDLDTNEYYHWNIKAYNSTGTGPWGYSKGSFKTTDTIIQPPSLYPVSEDNKDANLNPLFRWENTDAVKYELQISEVDKDNGIPDFVHPIYANHDVVINQFNLPFDLQKGTEYAWKIKAEHSNKRRTGWSDFEVFETKFVISVEDDNLLNGLEIYPNPTMNELNIKFLQNSEIPLAIEIINMLGETVFEKSDLNIHTDQITIDIINLSSGTYFVKYVTNNGVYQRKIIKE